MKYHVKAIFNAMISAPNHAVAKEKFMDKAMTKNPFHLQEQTIEVEEIGEKKKK